MDSHILPAFVGRWMKRNGTGFIRRAVAPNKRMQDLSKVKMLCSACEQRFSGGEAWFSDNVFLPYIEGGKRVFEYGHELYYFMVSVLWRGMEREIAALEVAEPAFAVKARGVHERWRRYLLDPTVVRPKGDAKAFLLFFDSIERADRPTLGVNLYLTSAADTAIALGGGHGFVSAVLPRFGMIGEIESLPEDSLRGSEITPSSGTISADGQYTGSPVSDFLVGRAEGAMERYYDRINEKSLGIIDRDMARLAPTSDLMKQVAIDELFGRRAGAELPKNARCSCGSGKKYQRCCGS